MSVRPNLNLWTLFFLILSIFIFAYSVPSISFVSPTPLNGTAINKTFFEANISIDESALSFVMWGFNNSNYSMYDNALMIAYNFDNRSIIGENDTFVLDISKYSNNASCIGSACPLWADAGKHSGAFVFDGTDDLLSAPQSTNFELQNISIETWIYLDPSPGARSAIVSYGWGTTSGGPVDGSGESFALSYQSDIQSFRFRLKNAAGANFLDLYSPSSSLSDQTTGKWKHILATWNGTDGNLYLDGSLLLTQSASGTINYLSDSSSKLRIGNWFGNDERWFKGKIDEMRIYNRSLTASEIKQHYYASLQKINSSYWLFYANASGLSNSHYIFFGCANDSIQNANCTQTNLITVDTTPPNIILNSPSNENYTNVSNSLNFNFTASDDFASLLNCSLHIDGVQNQTNSSVLNNTATVFTTSLVDGLHNWNIFCLDAAGNQGNASKRNITVDTTAPSVSIASPPSNVPIEIGNISFTFIATDNIDSSFACSLVVGNQIVGSNNSVLNNTLTTFKHYVTSSSSFYINCTDTLLNQRSAASSFLVIADSSSTTSSTKSILVTSTSYCNETIFFVSDSNGPLSASVYIAEVEGSYLQRTDTDSKGQVSVPSCSNQLRVQISKTGYGDIDTKITPICSCAQTVQCKMDSDCVPTQLCNYSMCVDKPKPQCTVDTDCSSDQMCQNNVCIVKPKPTCVIDTDCSSNQLCQNNLCVSNQSPLCAGDLDCPSDQICYDGICKLKLFVESKYEISAHIDANGQTVLNFIENGGTCSKCIIHITDPDGKQITSSADANGKYIFTPSVSGAHTFSILKENKVVKTQIMELDSEPNQTNSNTTSAEPNIW